MLKICPACGAEAPAQFRFCGFCATALEPGGEPAAEPLAPAESPPTPSMPEPAGRSARRLVTMLFADLSNYTYAAARVDPEALFLAMRQTLEQLSHPVAHLDGHIDRYVGDGFLATFGLPEAHEDDAIRAVQCAVDLQHTMEALRPAVQNDLGWDVQLRVGINLGPVISGQLDTGAAPDASVFGHAVNLAQRLQQAARPGTILVSEAVHRLARTHFEFRDPVSLHLKGLDTPVVAYEVLARRSKPLVSRGLAGRAAPLVGRAAESASLHSALQTIKIERQGLVALLVGEPGIGKSRLVDEVLAPLANHFAIVRAAGSPTETDSYGLITRMVENLAGISPDDTGAARRQRLDAWLAESSSLAPEVVPVLHLLAGGQPARDALIGNPQQDQRRIYAAMRRLVAWQARRRATLLVLDDLHWADPSSLAVLNHVADLVQEMPLGIILLTRAAGVEQLPPALRADACPEATYGCLRLDLGPLMPADSDQLIGALLSGGEPPRRLVQRLAERTSGNPLLIEEMVRMLLDQEVIRLADGAWRLSEGWAEAIRQVPDTVNGLILSRYDRLAAPLKHVLDSAAVLGPSFSLRLLLGLTELPEAELSSAVRALEQSDFLRRAPGGQATYVFRHWLLQEAIYETLLQQERRALHLRAAQVIQQLAESLAVDDAARLGYHLERARSREAIGHLLRSARRAADQYANDEAISTYHRLQALLDHHGPQQHEAVDVALGLAEVYTRTGQSAPAREALDSAHRLALGPPQTGYRLADVLYQTGLMRVRQGQLAEARAAFDAAAAHLREHGPGSGTVVTASDLERGIGMTLFMQGDFVQARAHAEAALQQAVAQSNMEAAGAAHNLLAASYYSAGQLSESVTSALRALEIREQLGDTWGLASTQSNLGGLYFKLGQWAQAESFLRQAIFVQQEIGDDHNLGASWNTLGSLLLDAGRYDEALHCLNQSIAVLRGQPNLPALALRHQMRGQVWLRLGVTTWAVADLERSLDAATRAKNDIERARTLAYLAEARLLEGNPTGARDFVSRAEALAAGSGTPESRAEVARARAAVAQAGGDWGAALKSARQAQALFEQIGNRYEVARQQLAAAEIYLASGNGQPRAEVLDELRAALETFRQLPAVADIPRAERALASLTAAGAPGHLGERAVALTHLHLRLPALAGEPEARHETMAAVVSRLHAALEKIGRERGAVVANSGAGITYLFVGPGAELSEAAAQQAVQAARDAIEATARLNAHERRQSALEIGLGAGLAAGQWLAASADPRQAAIFASASPPGRQAAMAAARAPANEVLVAGNISQLLHGSYELEVAAPAEAGAAGATFRLGRVRPESRPPQSLPGSTPQLVGRQAELAALSRWVEQLRGDRSGRLCYLEAEAGMGKTRLLEQVLAQARQHVTCLVGKCESFRAGMSYWPVLSMLEQTGLAETPAGRQLQALLGLGPAGAEAAGGAAAPVPADPARLHRLEPAGLRQEIFAQVRSLLLKVSAQQPVLIVLEDIHWLDLSSLDLIDYLLPLVLEAPISLMLVARAEMPGPHRALVRKAIQLGQERYLPITFGPLTAVETRTMVEALLQTTAVPDRLWPLLEPFTGHPLSVEEALRFLIESGWLWQAGGEWRLAATGPLAAPGEAAPAAARHMPVTFRDLLLRRLDLLPSETLHVLQAAALLGESFDHSVLGHVVGGPAVARRLSELVERGWLLAGGPEQPLLYQFKHTLTRETIYATLLTSKRRVLHQRAGEALETLYRDATADHVELLAYHFSHSNVRDKALGWLVRAGQAAAARHALAESLSYFQQARDIAARLPERSTRLLATIALGLADAHLAQGNPSSAITDLLPYLETEAGELPAALWAGLWRRLATARRRSGDFAAALEAFTSAREALTAAGPSAADEAAHVELGIAEILFDMRDNPRARRQAERVLQSVDRQRQPEIAAEALNLLGGLAHRQGEINTAVQLARESLAIHLAQGNRPRAAAVYTNLGVLAASRLDDEAAFSFLRLGLELREELGDSAGIAITRNNLGQLERLQGRFRAAAEHLWVAVARARHAELNPVLAQCLANLGQVLALDGQAEPALAALDEAEAVCRAFGLRNTRCEALWKRADCLLESGDLAAAEAAGLAALDLATEINSPDLRSEAQRALARIDRHGARTAAALTHAEAAWQARGADPNPIVRARFAAEYALSLAAAGDTARARAILAEHVAPVELPESDFTRQEVTAALSAR